MKPSPNLQDQLYCIKLVDRNANPAMGFELLSTLELDFNSYESKENGAVYHTIYCETPQLADALATELDFRREVWRDLGCDFEKPERFDMKKEEWSETWKKYFNIIHIADNLVIRPSWLEYHAAPGQAVVDIDPGMSFGTGQHATTAYCLKTIANLAGKPGVETMLDAGCGSGILSIAGAKLHYRKVTAFDFDPEAVRVASENIAINGLGKAEIDLFEGDATRYDAPQPFDLATVNILSGVLIANAPRIISWVRPQGYLALAGILSTEFDTLSKTFTDLGLTELDRFTEREWTSGLFLLP